MLPFSNPEQATSCHRQGRASDELDYHHLVNERGRVFDACFVLLPGVVQAARELVIPGVFVFRRGGSSHRGARVSNIAYTDSNGPPAYMNRPAPSPTR